MWLHCAPYSKTVDSVARTLQPHACPCASTVCIDVTCWKCLDEMFCCFFENFFQMVCKKIRGAKNSSIWCKASLELQLIL